jgi:hypothetical protein
MSWYKVEQWQPINPDSCVDTKVYASKIDDKLVPHYHHIMIPGCLYSSAWCPEHYMGYDSY